MGDVGGVVFMFGFVGAVVCVYTIPRMVIDGVLTLAEGLGLAGAMLLAMSAAAALAKVAPRVALVLMMFFMFTMGAMPYLRFRLRDRGNWSIAQQDIQQFEQALAFDPAVNSARVSLADIYRKMGQYAKAVTYYEDALDREPDNPEAKKGLDECLRLQSVARGETWLCHICNAANGPKEEQCFSCKTPRTKLVDVRPIHKILPWAFGAGQALVLLGTVVGLLGAGACVWLTCLVSGAFYMAYWFDPTGDI